jgi:hypothetical protein
LRITKDQNTKLTKEEVKRFKIYLHDRRCELEKNEFHEIKMNLMKEAGQTKTPSII